MPTALTLTAKGRIAILTGALLLVALTVGPGQAAAHNPACHLVAGPDGPHYDDDPQTGSEAATLHNPNLRNADHPDSLHPDHANSIHNRGTNCRDDS